MSRGNVLLTARDSFAHRLTGSGAFTVEVEDQEFACSTAALGGGAADASRSLSLTLAGGDGGGWTQQLQADVAFHGDEICVWVNGEHAAVPAIVHAPRGSDEAAAGGGSGGGNIVAPMPGKVVRVLVNEGDEVEEDQPLIGANKTLSFANSMVSFLNTAVIYQDRFGTRIWRKLTSKWPVFSQ